MANAASKLRDQARTAENRGQWTEAVVLYRQLLEDGEGEGETDIALWNRVGDLHMRIGETERAVEAYERAVSAYADSGLYNNAIALCRKILRLVPGRGAVYHRLGQISAAAGFLADARQNFLEYAQRMKRAGNLDASFDALREFADLSPDDTDVRKLLADQLLSHGRKDQAIEQLRVLRGAHQQRGDDAAAEAIREQIQAVAPGADDSPLMRSAAAAADDWSAALSDGDYGGGSAPARVGKGPPKPAARPAAADVGPTIDPPDVDVAPLAGLEATALDGGGDVVPLPGLESTSLVDDAPPARPGGLEAAGLDLPLLDEDEDGGEPLPLMLDDDDDGDGGALPLLIDGEDHSQDGGGDLPLMTFDDEPPRPSSSRRRAAEPVFEAAPDRLEELRAHVAAVPEDAASREELVRELRARGLGHEVEEVLENAHRSLAARGMYFEAVAPITALIGLRADDGILLQKRVEYAFRSGRAEAQVEAYLGLGRHLAQHGQESKAAAVIKRVLELDPHNVEARAAAAQIAPAASAPYAPPAPRPAAPQPQVPTPDYVDLGALIMDEGGGEPTTRFVVEEKEPSGDEDRDFAEMLAHFRQKVAENIEVEDSASHYDLGVAFMEMGLVDEAIAQFQVALRGGANPLATLELLGQCFVDKGQYAVAGRVLDRAQRLPNVADGDMVGVLYLLARIDEATGKPESAREFYERVVSVDIRFRDTAQRIERLKKG